MNIKDFLRRLIAEVAGVQMDVKKLSERLSDATIEGIIYFSNKDPKFNDGGRRRFSVPNSLSAEEEKNTMIHIVDLIISFAHSHDKKLIGSFNPKNMVRDEKNLLTVGIELELQLPFEELAANRTEIRSIIAHELNHAFVFIRDVNRKSAAINGRNRRNKMSVDSKDAGVKLLYDAIYLTNPMEVQARIQDIGGLVDGLKSDTAEDAIRELLLYPPLRDLAYLNRMHLNDVVLTDAVREFIRFSGGGDEKKFIDTLQKKVDITAREALRKVYRLLSDRYSVNEDFIFESREFRLIYDWD
jgi:hypothetical protein